MKIRLRLLYIILLVIMGILTVTAFCCSNLFPPNYYEYTTVEPDSLILHGLLLLLLIGYFRFIRPKFMHKVNWNTVVKILLPCSLLIVSAISLFWAIRCEYLPVWDPEYICRAALAIAGGNEISVLDAAYFGQYPHQMGLVWFYSLPLRIFGAGGEAFLTLHIFQALCMPLIVLNGYFLTYAFFEDKEVNSYYLIFATGCIALFFYVNFIYSDVPGILFVLMAVNSFVYYEKKKKLGLFAGGILLFILAISIRKNNIIFFIATVSIWLLSGILKRNKRKMAEALITAAFVLFAGQLLLNTLCSTYKINQDKAEPAIAWVAMGLQRSGYGAGWHNGFISNVYADKQGDSQAITEESIRQIKMSLMEFIKEPETGVKFFTDKMLIQWNQPCFQCLGLSKEYEKIPEGIVEEIYQGKAYKFMQSYFDCYQWIIYLGMTLYLWNNRKSQEVPLYLLIPLLAILGGGMFSMMWESKSRYILPYFFFMIPYAAKGFKGKS